MDREKTNDTSLRKASIMEGEAIVPRLSPQIIFIIIFLGFGSASMGYASSIIATTLSQPSWYATMKLGATSDVTALIGATNGGCYAGGAFGSIFSGYFAHKYGRKKSAALAALIILISSSLITASYHIAMFDTFRVFQGWGPFQILSAIPMWMAKLVPPHRRGMLVQIHPAMINTGYTVASYTGVGFFYYTGGGKDTWRGPLGLAGLFPLLLLLGIYWIPVSPRYLLSNDRKAEAWDVLRELHSDPRDPNHLFAKNELDQIEWQVQLDNAESAKSISGNYLKIFQRASFRKRFFMTFAQMSSGALVVNNYGGLIYNSLGFSNSAVLQMQGGYQLCGWLMNTANMFFIDRFPRNKLMCLGFATCGITVIIKAALQKHYLGTAYQPGLIACTAFLFLNVTCFGLFVEGPGFTYIAEIWPTFLRGEGYALGMCSLCVTSIIWLQSAPTAFETIGWKFYIIFIVIDAIAAVVVWFYPDTLGKPLEEIAGVFGDADMVALVPQRDGSKSDSVKNFGWETEKLFSWWIGLLYHLHSFEGRIPAN